MPRDFIIPKLRLPYILGRKLFLMKQKDGFGDKSWAEWFSYIAKTGEAEIRATVDKVIEDSTMDNLLPLWINNFAENIPYIRHGDSIKLQIPENSKSHSIADLGKLEPEIGKSPPENSAVIIGRGPDVFKPRYENDKNQLDLLAEYIHKGKFKGKICSTDGMLVECLKREIIPEITCGVDGSPIIAKWFDHPLVKKYGEQLKIILPVTTHHDTYQACIKNHCKVCWYTPIFDIVFRNESFTRIMRMMTKTTQNSQAIVSAQCGANSGTFTWLMSWGLLKLAPSALIGFSMGYPEGTNLESTPYFSTITKKEEVEFTYKEVYHPIFKTKSFIDAVFWHYRKGLLSLVQETPAWYQHYGGLYNCSEGGTLWGHGITCIPFKDFLEKHKK